jgi:hypothetical protein
MQSTDMAGKTGSASHMPSVGSPVKPGAAAVTARRQLWHIVRTWSTEEARHGLGACGRVHSGATARILAIRRGVRQSA